jgi:curved DNA-binding protein CbpA
MTAITETDVVQACQTLFGKELNVSKDFLSYMQPSGVKSAYRKKAKEHHPDFFAADPLHIQQKQTVLFREILRAYDVLNLFFKQREKGSWQPAEAPFGAARQTNRRNRRPPLLRATATKPIFAASSRSARCRSGSICIIGER